MLEENSFLMSKVGSKCGKCLESGRVSDGSGVTYIKTVRDEKEGEHYG